MPLNDSERIAAVVALQSVASGLSAISAKAMGAAVMLAAGGSPTLPVIDLVQIEREMSNLTDRLTAAKNNLITNTTDTP